MAFWLKKEPQSGVASEIMSGHGTVLIVDDDSNGQ